MLSPYNNQQKFLTHIFVFLLLLAEAVRGREYCVGAGIGGLASETRPPSTAIKPQPPWSWGPDVWPTWTTEINLPPPIAWFLALDMGYVSRSPGPHIFPLFSPGSPTPLFSWVNHTPTVRQPKQARRVGGSLVCISCQVEGLLPLAPRGPGLK